MKTRKKTNNNFFVKPLYKNFKVNKVNDSNKSTVDSYDVINDAMKGVMTIEIDKSVKLVGDGLNIKNIVKSGKFKNYKTKYLPGTCDISGKNERYKSEVVFKKYPVDNNVVKNSDINKMLSIDDGKQEEDKNKGKQTIVIHEIPDTWLRVYPARSFSNESICSIIFRCVCCQLGLFSFLSIWTLIFVMVIHSIEGPYEIKVGEEFEVAQNELIIGLATELRQTKPYSDKWHEIIEREVIRERSLAINAVKKGARVHAGTFWDIAGTFLFCVYVMTALGFGAPVPQTGNGRMCSLAYAVVSVPTHIFLMVNLSSCVVHQVEECFIRTKTFLKRKSTSLVKDEIAIETPAVTKSRNKILGLLRVISIGRCVPLATCIYYIMGVLVFGVARKKPTGIAVLFPLEFTTTGGLEHVEDYVRFLYGMYIEGAMTLLACGLATLRRHSSSAVTNMTAKYRLFKSERCKLCYPNNHNINGIKA